MARLLASRGITTLGDLGGELGELIQYSELTNAESAAQILLEHIRADKHIVVSCDFDVDGCTAGAIALRGLREMGARRLDFAMPNREKHGYGLTSLLVEEIHARFAPDLILTVDCGISSFEGVAKARALGIGVLVTDHHLPAPDGTLPEALCIVNPNQLGCRFPSKHLSGAGVIFYVLLALRAHIRAMNGERGPSLSALLDMVALSTIADVVRLDRNNRILVRHGLARIRAGLACAGINALIEVAQKQPGKATVFDLGFIIGPRLNAAGRLEDMSLGIKCLTTDNPNDARAIANELDSLNKERRSIESDMKDSAGELLEKVDIADSFSIVLTEPTWHPGVIGILASRLKDRYNRPTIIFAECNGKLKGAGRSIPGLHLRDAIDQVAKRHPGMLPTYGGHAMAAGLTCCIDRFDDFVSEFEIVVRESLTENDLLHMIETDGALSGTVVSVGDVTEIENGIWGQGFAAPVFDDDCVILEQRVLKDAHLKLRVQVGAESYDAIWFFHTDRLPERAHLVYSLGINEYMGNKRIQMLIRDVVN